MAVDYAAVAEAWRRADEAAPAMLTVLGIQHYGRVLDPKMCDGCPDNGWVAVAGRHDSEDWRRTVVIAAYAADPVSAFDDLAEKLRGMRRTAH